MFAKYLEVLQKGNYSAFAVQAQVQREGGVDGDRGVNMSLVFMPSSPAQLPGVAFAQLRAVG